MEKMREEFEAWFWNEFHRGSDITFYWDSVFAVSGNGEYCGMACHAYWTVWQAGWKKSRAELCVEIPTDGEASSFGNYVVFDSDDVRAMLDEAGVQYK